MRIVGEAAPASGRVAFDAVQARAIVLRHQHVKGALLPILHEMQEMFGYVDAQAVPLIAEGLNVSKAEVHGVISFYHDFRHAPAGKYVLKICRAEACQAMGVEALVDHLSRAHGVDVDAHETRGNLTIENVYCLGNCALGPSAMLNGELIGRLDQDQLDQIVSVARTGVQ